MIERPDRRQMMLGAILLGGAAVAAVARGPKEAPDIGQAALADAIPEAVGPYRYQAGLDAVLPPRDELSERLYDRYIARGYVAAGLPPIMLVIAYGATQDYGLQLHRPESCYPASGWAIGRSHPIRVPIGDRLEIRGTTLDATRPGKHEQILYWTRIGSAFPNGIWADRFEILRGAMSRHLPDGVLVRLSTPSKAAGTGIDAMIHFNSLLIDGVNPAGRRLLLGSTG